MVKRKYCLELPVQGTDQYYRVAETIDAEIMAEVVRSLLKCGAGEPINIRIVSVPIEIPIHG